MVLDLEAGSLNPGSRFLQLHSSGAGIEVREEKKRENEGKQGNREGERLDRSFRSPRKKQQRDRRSGRRVGYQTQYVSNLHTL